MNRPPSPDDRPDPSDEQPAVRARVPDTVSRGAFGTGVIVMTGPMEFILDFVQNLGRPHQVVARIVLPFPVMPQFADALAKNIDLYENRFGPLPVITPPNATPGGPGATPSDKVTSASSENAATGSPPADPPGSGVVDVGMSGSSGVAQSSGAPVSKVESSTTGQVPPTNTPQQPPPPPRQPTAQEVYDDLKLRDELLSGAYANAVMIGHGPHEFSFDFITNFYPQSSVSCRVFMAAGQVGRVLESLRGAWEQFRSKGRPGNPPFQDPPGDEGLN